VLIQRLDHRQVPWVDAAGEQLLQVLGKGSCSNYAAVVRVVAPVMV
jgi:hypothetical protein